MMRTVLKFEVKPRMVLTLPAGSEFLAVQIQHGEPRAWFLCEQGAPNFERTFICVPTGEASISDEEYLGTFQLGDGALVFHLFEDIGASRPV